MSLYTTELKKGDFVRIAVQDGWETSEFGWDGDDFYRYGKYGIVIEPYHKVFNQPYGYDTWKIRLISGQIAIYPARELELLASA